MSNSEGVVKQYKLSFDLEKQYLLVVSNEAEIVVFL
jgi:hypothetical protein